MAPKIGPIGRKLRKHLNEILSEHAALGSGRSNDEALLAELRYRHPQDYGANMKSQGLLREISNVRTELERASSASNDSEVAFRHSHPLGAVVKEEGDFFEDKCGQIVGVKRPLRNAGDVTEADTIAHDREAKRFEVSIQIKFVVASLAEITYFWSFGR
jgi:hypothetical protein